MSNLSNILNSRISNAGAITDLSGIPATLTLLADADFEVTGYAIAGEIPADWMSSQVTLTGLSLGQGVTSIADYAFSQCYGFTGSLVIPSSVQEIASHSFYNCSGFTGELILGDSLTSIGNYAFNGCSGFTGTLTIPSSVTSIGNYAFAYCFALTNINCYVPRFTLDSTSSLFESGVTTIHARASDTSWSAGVDIVGGIEVTVIKDL